MKLNNQLLLQGLANIMIGVEALTNFTQFSSVQFSCSAVSDSLRPLEPQHARPPCPSPTPGGHPNSCIESVMPSSHLILSSPSPPALNLSQHQGLFTQRALNDSLRAIQALNTEQIQVRKAGIQHWMALDILTATQGGICAIIKVECCVCIPDLSGNVSATLDNIKGQVKAMPDGNLPFWTSVLSWVKGDWRKTVLTIVIITLLILLCGPCILQCVVNFVSLRQSSFTQIYIKIPKAQFIPMNDAHTGS